MPDQATRVIAIRHGETDWNLEGRVQGHLDVPLNPLGLQQAERLAQALGRDGIDVVYSSDLMRARQTAEAVVRQGGQPFQLEPGLRERDFGSFQGLTFSQIEAQFPEQARLWRERDPDYRPGGGESLNLFYARCLEASLRLARAHPGQTIALVAHGGVMDCLYRAATHQGLQAPRSWPLENASINRLLCTAEGFVLMAWGDTSHLQEGPRDESDPGPHDRVGSLA